MAFAASPETTLDLERITSTNRKVFFSQAIFFEPTMSRSGDFSRWPGPLAVSIQKPAYPSPHGQSLPLPPSGNGPIAELGNVRKGWVAAFLVMVLGFFLAAGTVRNTDFWLHLASGKAIAQGDWQADPFSYTSGEAGQVNHFWLYELIGYWLHLAAEESGLVILKCLMVVGLAWVLLACGRVGNSLLLPALGAALSLVALGPWLAIKPFGVSILFLAMTLFFLERMKRRQPRPGQESSSFAWRDCWPLFPLFVLWANMDRWFFLGPALVAIYFAGSLFPAGWKRPPSTTGSPAETCHGMHGFLGGPL